MPRGGGGVKTRLYNPPPKTQYPLPQANSSQPAAAVGYWLGVWSNGFWVMGPKEWVLLLQNILEPAVAAVEIQIDIASRAIPVLQQQQLRRPRDPEIGFVELLAV